MSKSPAKPKISEAEILRSILDYLAARLIFAVRMNSGTQIGSHKGKKWAIHMNAAGTADILALPRRACAFNPQVCNRLAALWIEVKTATGKQSELQKSFQAQVEAEGHRYILARSIEDVEAALR